MMQQISHTAYRGIVTKKFASAPKEVHGKFTYRGHTYLVVIDLLQIG